MNKSLYERAFNQEIDLADKSRIDGKAVKTKENLKSIVFYGIKLVNLGEDDIELINIILESVKLINPIELMEMYPLDKYYDPIEYYEPLDHDSFYENDYKTSLEYIEKFGFYNKIDDPMFFLAKYMNNHIRVFVVNAKKKIDANYKENRVKNIRLISPGGD